MRKTNRYRDKSHNLKVVEEDHTNFELKKSIIDENNPVTQKQAEANLLELANAEDPNWWKTNHFKKEYNPTGLLDTSRFTILFPQYREAYFKKVWPLVEHVFHQDPLHLKVELNAKSGNIMLETTKDTYDPCAVLIGRDMLLLMARGMSFEQVKLFLSDNADITYDVIKIKSLVRDYKIFMKRRQRLLGPNNATLTAIQLVTGCQLLVQGKSVCAIGPVNRLKEVRTIVEDCMRNVHPIYHIKQLMVKRELEKNPQMQTENWGKFLPQFKKNVRNKSQVKKKIKQKKKYSPFPPEREESKVDKMIASGEYFLSPEEREKKQKEMKHKSQNEKSEQKRNMKQELLSTAPAEKKSSLKKPTEEDGDENMEERVKNVQDKLNKRKRDQTEKDATRHLEQQPATKKKKVEFE